MMRRGQTGAAEKDETGVVINTRSRRSVDCCPSHGAAEPSPIRAPHITSGHRIASVTSGAASSSSRSGGQRAGASTQL